MIFLFLKFIKNLEMVTAFENNKILAQDLPNYEAVSGTALDKKYYFVVLIGTFIVFAFISLGLILCFFLFDFLKFMPYKQAAAVAYFAFWGLYVLYSWVGFKRKSYCYRTHDVIYNFGVFHKTTILIPFNRIQHIALHQGFFSRKFGLASLQFYTAGGSATDVNIPGMPLDTAKSFKEAISEKIEN
jgi:membrane protein YdbS with pleckstrin-like domain